jgi:hypothetical protein
LPQEKRKGYLLRPQQTLTLQGLVDRILEADGITKEMVQAQQQRLSLIQRLLMASSDDMRIEIIRQEDQLIDEELFVLLERLLEASSASGDQNSSQKLADLQKMILLHSTFGQDLSSQLKEVEEAVKELKTAGKELTREKLLEIVVNAPNEERLKALVSLVRPGMDYIFFQLLSEKIDRARGDGRARLVQLRDQLLKLTQEYDQAWNARVAETQKKLDSILTSDDVERALMEQSPVVDELFITVLQSTMEKAEQEKDQQKLEKLERIENEADQRKLLEENKSEVSADLMNTLTNLVYQFQNSDNKELADKLSKLYKVVLRHSMESSLKES